MTKLYKKIVLAVSVFFLVVSVNTFASNATWFDNALKEVSVDINSSIPSVSLVNPIARVNGNLTIYADDNGEGIIIPCLSGTSVYACETGIVISAKNSSNEYGKHIIIDHGNGIKTLYASLEEMHVSAGDKVQQGQNIASTGRSEQMGNERFMFAVYFNEQSMNPLDIIFFN